MTTPLKYLFSALLMTALIFTYGCDFNSQSSDSFGNLEVWLHDDPGNFEEVQIYVERVEVNREDDSEGWIVISEPQQHFDLLKLTNGEYEVLGSEELEAGTYPQIRLILSQNDNYIIENGETKSLFVPSGAQTGVKLNVNAEIEAGSHYVLLLDFDVKRSIVQPGAGSQPADYLLKPVIRTANLAESGNIGGVISPADVDASVHAISGSDTLSTTFPDAETGEFLLFGLPEGSYTVSIDPESEEFEITDVEDVTVTAGETNDLDVIELEIADSE